jgi:hypothetical protein
MPFSNILTQLHEGSMQSSARSMPWSCVQGSENLQARFRHYHREFCETIVNHFLMKLSLHSPAAITYQCASSDGRLYLTKSCSVPVRSAPLKWSTATEGKSCLPPPKASRVCHHRRQVVFATTEGKSCLPPPVLTDRGAPL